MKPLFFTIIASVAFSLVSCAKTGSVSIEREDLWTFRIGRLEDELDLFNLQNRQDTAQTTLAMRDGFFYIANGAGGKVLHYNSYGDLLFMIYNSETNPVPLSLKSKTENMSATRWSVAWPLNEPGAVTVDSTRNIYVADKLTSERQSYNSEEKVMLSWTVLRFDIDGNFTGYLGQEGPGGSPFPLIDNIYVSANDDLAVVCRLPQGMDVYWFNNEGLLLHTVSVRNNKLPAPNDRGKVQAVLNGIAVAPDSKTLYLKIDYYREIHDETTQVVSGMEPDSSALWVMNVEDGSFRGSVDIPFFEGSITVNRKRSSENLLYTMFGAMAGGSVFFYFPVETGFALLVLDSETGAERAHGSIRVDNNELNFFTFNVSSNGVLSALLAGAYEAKLVWWRTDRFLK
ncbi:MAG: hypothetical protein LBG74_07185 [Spirochaetaceae bacterium]|jgi:hypothetical protein|nr:hypothetical protein [Spirochaetaceae bacterium]